MTFSTADAMAATGATFRQADYAARKGVASAPAPGSGNPREWKLSDVIRLGVYVSVSELLSQSRGGVRVEDILSLLDSADVLTGQKAELGDGPAKIVVDLVALRRRIRRRLGSGATAVDRVIRRTSA